MTGRGLLLLSLLLMPVPVAAQDEGSGDVPDGPVRLRPPEVRPAFTLEPPTEGEEGEAETVAPVFDPAVFEGVFEPYRVVNGREIRGSLTGEAGDPGRGRTLFFNSSVTGCSLCHGVPEVPRPEDDESTGPDLHGVGGRQDEGHLRLWIVAPETLLPGTEMPAFHKPGQREDPTDPLYGGPRLSADEVEDLVAYLMSLSAPDQGSGG